MWREHEDALPVNETSDSAPYRTVAQQGSSWSVSNSFYVELLANYLGSYI